MFTKRFFSLALLSVLVFSGSLAFAQDLPEEIVLEENTLTAVIDADRVVMVGRSIIFDASDTFNPEEDKDLTYEWHLGDGNRQQGVEIVHSYGEPGEYQVTLVVRNIDGEQDTITHEVFVYERTFLLITDNSEESEKLTSLVDYAKQQGVFVNLIGSFGEASEFLSEEALLQQLQESSNTIKQANTVVLWTVGSSGLTILSQLSQGEEGFFNGADIIVISKQNLANLQNIAQGTFRTVNPRQIVITRQEALWPLVDAATVSDFLADLELRGVTYRIVDSPVNIGVANFMSYFVNYMLEKGVPSNSLKLVLMLPVIIMMVAFLKQVVGLETLGVYIPSILALSFIALGLKFGLFILFVILFFGTLSRLILKRYRLLYIPRMAIVLTITSIVILVMLLMGAFLNVTQMVSISIFPMLIMSTLVERFISIQTGKGLKSALIIIFEVTLVAVICYFVAEWSSLKTLMLGHPELIFACLAFNVVLGRWAGLRVMEYFRFREIFRYSEEE
ncbi:MAG: 7TM domain-containing protein [Patescibacteria group bacterium]|nr:PKD domain-containing protein [Patescibacteria group bacterium]